MWKHSKYKNRAYTGHYLWIGKERVFALINREKEHCISYESHQMAKRDGWSKQ